MNEKIIIKKLKELEKIWPKDYWLFSASGTLFLMKMKNGKRVLTDNGAMDQDYSIEKFPGILSDGGDW